MEKFNLLDSQVETIKYLIKTEIGQIAQEEKYFEENHFNPTNHIDEWIALCRQFNLDFWNVLGMYGGSHYQLERMKALYIGQTLKEFSTSYREPTKNELLKYFAKPFIKEIERLKKLKSQE